VFVQDVGYYKMKFILNLAVLASAAVAGTVLPRAAPVLPSLDAFYQVPSNIASYKPGQVIKSRDISPDLGGFTGLTEEPIKRFVQVLYRTTDALGNATAAVTSILIPNNANNTQLLAYQQAYDSANDNCSPSYQMQTGANSTAVADIIFISAALNKGYYVVTSDYEGFNAEFTVGQQSGHATLDSVRATLNLAPKIGLSPKALYAMWGYSGGALASEWAAELQPSYAPELKFEGAALGGLTPNVTSVLFTINKTPFSGLAFSGITGIVRAVPSAAQLFSEVIIPSKKAEFDSIAAGCLAQTVLQGGGKNLFDYFNNGEEAVQDPRFKNAAYEYGQMGHTGVPAMPIFAYKAEGDEVSPVNDTNLLVNTLCSKGAIIEYHRDLIGEHATESLTGSVSAFGWIQDRLDGKPVSNKACVTEEVILSSIGPTLPEGLTIELVSLLESLLGSPVPLGPLIGKKR